MSYEFGLENCLRSKNINKTKDIDRNKRFIVLIILYFMREDHKARGNGPRLHCCVQAGAVKKEIDFFQKSY